MIIVSSSSELIVTVNISNALTDMSKLVLKMASNAMFEEITIIQLLIYLYHNMLSVSEFTLKSRTVPKAPYMLL